MASSSKRIRPYPKAYWYEPRDHAERKNLSIYYDNQLNGFTLQERNKPFVYPYLKQLINLITDTYANHSKIFAVRFDLHFPCEWTDAQRLNLVASDSKQAPFAKDYFSRFINSLEAKLKAIAHRDQQQGKAVRSMLFEYARAIEFSQAKRGQYNNACKSACQGQMHIHVLLLLNGQRYRAVGDYGRSNDKQDEDERVSRYLSDLIFEAWGSALYGKENTVGNHEARQTARKQGQSLVKIAKQWHHSLHDKLERERCMKELVCWSSYLCKAHTKRFKVEGKVIQPFVTSLKASDLSVPYSADKTQFHRGNPLCRLIDGFSTTDYELTEEGPYIKLHLDLLYRCLDSALLGRLRYPEDCFTRNGRRYVGKKYLKGHSVIHLQLRILDEAKFLKNRIRYSYAEKLFRRLNAKLKREYYPVFDPQNPQPPPYDPKFFRVHAAQVRKQDEQGQFIEAFIVLPDLVAQDWFHWQEKPLYSNDYLETVSAFMQALAKEVYPQPNNESSICLVKDVFRIQGNLDQMRKQGLRCFQAVSQMALSEPSASISSTLFTYPRKANKSPLVDCNDYSKKNY